MSPATEPGTYTPSDLPTLLTVGIDTCFESPTNPRTHFTDAELAELAASIREKGVLQPCLVRPKPLKAEPTRHRFEIVAGARRFRASKLAGRMELPIIVRPLSDDDVLEMQLIENVQRNDLTPLEEAHGYQRLLASNQAKYSAAYIADKIGRSERYVLERVRLTQLIPEAQELLEREIILVGHADILSTLTPADQKEAIKPPTHGYGGGNGALFENRDPVLELDVEKVDGKKDKYDGVKAKTVREFAYWVAHNIRLDPAHAAAVQPLDFGELPAKIAEAEARPGRGAKVVAITFDYRVSDGARDGDEKTFGKDHWRKVGAKPCDRQKLGVVVSGEHRGESFDVCVIKDCEVHWPKEAKQRKKNAELRAQGKPTKARENEAKQREREEERRKAEQAKGALNAKRFRVLQPLVAAAILAKVPDTLTKPVALFLARNTTAIQAAKPKDLVRALVAEQIKHAPSGDWYWEGHERELLAQARHFGVNVEPLQEQARAAVEPKEPIAAAKKKAAKKR